MLAADTPENASEDVRLVGGILAALLLLFLDHVSSEWTIRRDGSSRSEQDQPGGGDAEP